MVDPAPVEVQRWYILFLYSYLAALQSLNWMTYSSVPQAASKWLGGASPGLLDLILNWGPIAFLIALPVAAFVLQSRSQGLRISMILASGLCFAGAVIRSIPLLIPHMSHTVVLVCVHAGQILNAAAAPFVVISPSALSQAWFPPSERNTATSIANSASALGRAVGFWLGPAVASSVQSFSTLLWLELGLATFPLCCALVHLPNNPSTPPSTSAASFLPHQPHPLSQHASLLQLQEEEVGEVEEVEEVDGWGGVREELGRFWVRVRKLCESWRVWALVLGGGLQMGVWGGWSGILTPVLTESNTLTTRMAGFVGVGGTFGGILGSIVAGIVTDFPFLQKRLKSCMTLASLLSTALFLLLALYLYPFSIIPFTSTPFVPIFLMATSAGFVRGILDPLYFELLAEAAHPLDVDAGTAGGVLAFAYHLSLVAFLTTPPNLLARGTTIAMAASTFLAVLLLHTTTIHYSRRILDEATVEVHRDRVTAVAIGPQSGQLYATGSERGSVRIWRVGKSSPLTRFRCEDGGSVRSLAFDPSECIVGVTTSVGGVLLADLAGKSMKRVSAGGGEGEVVEATAVSFHPGSAAVFATGRADGVVQLWDVRTRDIHGTYEGDAGSSWVGFSPNGRWLFSGMVNGDVACWDVVAGKTCPTISSPFHDAGKVTWMQFHPTELQCVIGYTSSEVPALVDLSTFTSRPLHLTPSHPAPPSPSPSYPLFVGGGNYIATLASAGIRIDPISTPSPSPHPLDASVAGWTTLHDAWLSPGAISPPKSASKPAILVATNDPSKTGTVTLWGITLIHLLPFHPSHSSLHDTPDSKEEEEKEEEEEEVEEEVEREEEVEEEEVEEEEVEEEVEEEEDETDERGFESQRVSHSPERVRSPKPPPIVIKKPTPAKKVPELKLRQRSTSPLLAKRRMEVRSEKPGSGRAALERWMRKAEFFVAGGDATTPRAPVGKPLIPSTRHEPLCLNPSAFLPQGSSGSSSTPSPPHSSRRTQSLLELAEEGTGVVERLRSRLDVLRMVARLWKAGDVGNAITTAVECSDESVHVDVVSSLSDTRLDLDHAISIAPLCLELIGSSVKEHCVAGVHAIISLAKQHAPLLQRVLHTERADLPGVDLAAEERRRKCAALQAHFKTAASLIAAAKQRPAVAAATLLAAEELQRALHTTVSL